MCIMRLISAFSVGECVRWGYESGRGESSLWVCVFGSSEEEDVWFGSMEFVVDPSSGLLDSESSPFLR